MTLSEVLSGSLLFFFLAYYIDKLVFTAFKNDKKYDIDTESVLKVCVHIGKGCYQNVIHYHHLYMFFPPWDTY